MPSYFCMIPWFAQYQSPTDGVHPRSFFYFYYGYGFNPFHLQQFVDKMGCRHKTEFKLDDLKLKGNFAANFNAIKGNIHVIHIHFNAFINCFTQFPAIFGIDQVSRLKTIDITPLH